MPGRTVILGIISAFNYSDWLIRPKARAESGLARNRQMSWRVMKMFEDDMYVPAASRNAAIGTFVLCESRAAESRVRTFWEGLAWRVGPENRFFKRVWRLSLLATPLLQERAAVEAAQSRVIIVALDRRSGAPDAVQEWLARWLDHKSGRHYLVGVIQEELNDCDPPDSLADLLKAAVARAGATYFCWNELTGCDFDRFVPQLATAQSEIRI